MLFSWKVGWENSIHLGSEEMNMTVHWWGLSLSLCRGLYLYLFTSRCKLLTPKAIHGHLPFKTPPLALNQSPAAQGATLPWTFPLQYTPDSSLCLNETSHFWHTLNTHRLRRPSVLDIWPHTPVQSQVRLLFPWAQWDTLLFPATTSSFDWWWPPANANKKL